MISSSLRSYGVGRILQLNKSLFQYSTAVAAVVATQPQSNFLVPHLQNLLGFSKEEAISATRKVRIGKSSKKDPTIVISFFESLGLNKTQIKKIVSGEPRLLLYDIDKTLKPKIRVLQELGLSSSDLKRLLVSNKLFFSLGADSRIKYTIQQLRKVLGSNKNVVAAILRYNQLFYSSKIRSLELNVEALKNIGIPNVYIVKYVVRYPRRVAGGTNWLEGVRHKVEHEFGIPPESKMFFHGIDVVSRLKKVTIDAKFEIFRSSGFTDEQIYGMFRSFPSILLRSEDKIRATVDYFEGLGHSVEYLACCPVIFGLSLDKRIKPRCELFKVLKEKKLVKKIPQLTTFLKASELKISSSYLLPYKDEIADSYRSYIESIGRHKFETMLLD